MSFPPGFVTETHCTVSPHDAAMVGLSLRGAALWMITAVVCTGHSDVPFYHTPITLAVPVQPLPYASRLRSERTGKKRASHMLVHWHHSFLPTRGIPIVAKPGDAVNLKERKGNLHIFSLGLSPCENFESALYTVRGAQRRSMTPGGSTPSRRTTPTGLQDFSLSAAS